jgi:sulfate adenylyltransferase subunit 1
MVTGASNAKAAIVLIDARKGVVEQTYRHFFINALLRVKDVVVAVNKMDLVDFDQKAFENIKSTFQELVNKHGFDGQRITFIPISALRGDNVVERSAAMSWYQGPSILELLEDIPVVQNDDTAQFRFPVQTVIRPKTDGYHDFRGYAGKVYGSSIAVGDAISVLPWGTTSKVKAIHYYDTQYNEAAAGSAVTLELEDDINIARGDMLVKLGEAPAQEKRLKATICWMDRNPLRGGAKYLVQHNTNKVLAKIGSVDTVLATDFSENSSADGLNLNQIGEVSLQLAKPVFADSYAQNKHNGSFILIDPQTHTTAGVGFVQ